MGWILHYRKYSISDHDLALFFVALCFFLFVVLFLEWALCIYLLELTILLKNDNSNCIGLIELVKEVNIGELLLDFSSAIIWESRGKMRRKCTLEGNSGSPVCILIKHVLKVKRAEIKSRSLT